MEGHICKREKEIDGLVADVKKTVSFNLFWSILLVALAISSGVVANIFSQIDEIHASESEFHKDIEAQVNSDKIIQVRIETQLAQIQKEILKLSDKIDDKH